MIFSTIDKKTGKIQLFQFCLNDPQYFHLRDIIVSYSTSVDFRDIQKAINDLDNINKYRIYAIPLSITDPLTPVNDRNQHRGYDNDTDPLIIRKKPLKELRVNINNDDTLYFQHMSTYSDGQLTSSQKEELAERFPDLVKAFLDPQTYKTLADAEKIRIVEYLKEPIALMRRKLDMVEKFNP